MPNVTEIYTLLTQSTYLSDGVKQAVEGLLRDIPPALKLSDNITFYSNASISTNVVSIDGGAGSRPLAVVCESRGTAGVVMFYNQDGTASVSVTSSDSNLLFTVPVPSTTGEVIALSLHGPGWASLWSTGLMCRAATLATSGTGGPSATVMTNMPRVYLLYVNA